MEGRFSQSAADARVSLGEPASRTHDSIVAALDRAATLGAPLFSFHLGKQTQHLDAEALRESAYCWAARLHHAGVRRRHPVAILLPTSVDFAGALMGTMMLGAIPAPLASPMTFGAVDRFLRSLQFVIADSGARCIVTTPRMRTALAEIRSDLAEVRSSSPLPLQVLTPQSDSERRARDRGALNGPLMASIGASDPGLLQYTSGTTGRPKGVLVSHGALTSNADAIRAGLELTHNDIGVSWLPMFHDMGLIGVLLTCICHPYPMHLLRPAAFVMCPERWLNLISKTRATVSAAPNFAYQLCVDRARHGSDLSLDSWRVALNASEQVHRRTMDAFSGRYAEYGFRAASILPAYGMAENTLAVSFAPHEAPPKTIALDRAALQKEGVARAAQDAVYEAVSVGRAVRGTRIRIRNNAQTLSDNLVGEVEVAGNSQMDGYYGNPAATEEVIRDGWLRTGDLGFMRDGELYIVGRKKEVIIKGGRNIFPTDVEDVALQRDDTIAAAAVGVPDPTSGTDRLLLMVETRQSDPEERATLERLIRGDVLACLSVRIDDIQFCGVGALPRTTSGKIRRRQVSEQQR